MKVWQPGIAASSSLAKGGGRRLVVGGDEAAADGALPPRPALPAAGRALAIGSLLAATAASLAPPILIGRAVDDVNGTATRARSRWLVVGVRRRERGRRRLLLRADLLHRLDGRADARRPPQPPLPPPAAALARLLRAEPRRRPDQPADERRRGARPARHRRRHLADPEHADARRRRGDPVLPLLAARARDAARSSRRSSSRTAIFRKKSGRSYRRVRETLGAVTATLAEDIAGHARAAGVHPRARGARELPAGRRGLPAPGTRRRSIQNALYFPFVDLLSSLATAIILGYGGYLVFDGQTTIGVLTAFLGYATNFFDPVQQLSQLYSTFLSAVAALDKIMEVLVEEPQVTDEPGAPSSPRIRGHVRFDDVHFSLRHRARRCCTGSTSTSPPGTTVALVGHTGRRQVDDREADRALLRPDRGRDHDRRHRPARRHARSRCAGSSGSCRRRASSSPARSPRTSPSAGPRRPARRSSRRRARSAPTSSSTGSRTATTPSSASAASGSRSASASSSPSRARSSPIRAILILDEATSSVDIGTEQRIERALRRLLHGRTAFIIAHRLSTIRGAEPIVVLEHGGVVEQGTHDELLARGGRYAELYGSWAAEAERPTRRRVDARCHARDHRDPLVDRRVVLEQEVLPGRRVRVAERRRHEAS